MDGNHPKGHVVQLQIVDELGYPVTTMYSSYAVELTFISDASRFKKKVIRKVKDEEIARRDSASLQRSRRLQMSVGLATSSSSSAPEVATATTALGASVASVAPGDNVSIRLVGSTSYRVTFDVGINGGNREEREEVQDEDGLMDGSGLVGGGHGGRYPPPPNTTSLWF
ncbi:hypothetical protein INT45_004602 [Circinella minor]|uniref:Uncharacterized protein n=1 Tax=Circinella minor TaxID=1195481 RepID=A0A8H7VFP1_9FUNG|nr:hypothetical protein INT45_004602 [Circinella minor]